MMRSLLLVNGLDIQITGTAEFSEVPAGQVISQDPSAASEDGDTAYGNPDETITIVP